MGIMGVEPAEPGILHNIINTQSTLYYLKKIAHATRYPIKFPVE